MQQTPIQQAIKHFEDIDRIILTPVQVSYILSLFLHSEQTFLQQHAEGFAEWAGTNVYACDYSIGNDLSWTLHDGVDSNIYTTSELYTKYIEYINSLK